MWSSDYPHNVSTWPHSAERIESFTHEAALGDDDLARFVGGNAAKLYGL